jgi:putative transposase
LRDWLRQYAKDHPRRGFRPAYHDARAEGWKVNHKKIQWLWREEGLRVPQRRRRKRHGAPTAPGGDGGYTQSGVGGGFPVRSHDRRAAD